MKRKKVKKNVLKLKNKSKFTNNYVCSNCGVTEEIPMDVLEYFDEINPQQIILGGHQFKCESCNSGIMKPDSNVKPLIMGFGLFDGFEGV